MHGGSAHHVGRPATTCCLLCVVCCRSAVVCRSPLTHTRCHNPRGNNQPHAATANPRSTKKLENREKQHVNQTAPSPLPASPPTSLPPRGNLNPMTTDVQRRLADRVEAAAPARPRILQRDPEYRAPRMLADHKPRHPPR